MHARRAIAWVVPAAVVGSITLTAPLAGQSVAPHPMLVAVNEELARQGHTIRVETAEYFTSGDGDLVGQTIFANDRGNKQLGHHFIPGDPRRGGVTDIAWIVDRVDGVTASGLTSDDTTAAIDGAMATWQGANCSTIPLTSLGAVDADLGLVQFQLGFGGSPDIAADVSHAGWLPAPFFDLVAPGGSTSILGVTFTFIFVDPVTADPTDLDGNGKLDTAFREIYYNDNFEWRVDGGNVDVETVALHESGHGLSQAHFGKIFRTEANGKLHFAPFAVMNAAYSRTHRTLTGTDNGGHCSIWGAWPTR
ncbi:MAG: hypothetical protein GEU99_07465 [Luteitalea sp.]|nr:hypothetical protein [Luteitalea sp.]